MKFATFSLADAQGTILAHSAAIPGGVLKKGRRLSANDVAALQSTGLSSVMAAQLETGDITEDVAARRVAEALAGYGTRLAEAFTGRCNIYATAAGLVHFDPAAVAAVNADPRITIATLPAYDRVAAGDMIATVKIIPFAVPDTALATALAASAPARLAVAAFQHKRIGLVLTSLPATKASILAKRVKAIETRLNERGSTIAAEVRVPHTIAAVATAVKDLTTAGCDPVLVFAASAIVDEGDVIPAGLVAAGGHIIRLGMPVDPGNLLLLGARKRTTVIGIPSCASSPKLNGFDWVLERVLAGLTVTSADIAAMGVGGLLKEIPTRPQPRSGDVAAPRQAPRIACLVLAAGRATRMGANKLAADLVGKPIVRHVVDAAQESQCTDVIVVTGNEPDQVALALEGANGVQCVHNPDFAGGLSTSLRCGLAAVPAHVDGVIVALGDMPEVTAQHLNRLIAAFSPADNRSIIVPTRAGKRGNPVLWSRAFFADMAAVTGDTGAKHLLASAADQVAEIEIDSNAVLTDIDTPEALAALRARFPDPRS
jgi:molybdenum cofactor cytidylyltransferase